jgi:hypothetical protein
VLNKGWLGREERRTGYPQTEHFQVATLAGIAAKARPGFDTPLATPDRTPTRPVRHRPTQRLTRSHRVFPAAVRRRVRTAEGETMSDAPLSIPRIVAYVLEHTDEHDFGSLHQAIRSRGAALRETAAAGVKPGITATTHDLKPRYLNGLIVQPGNVM